MDPVKSPIAAISESQWSRLAQLAKVTPQEIQSRYQQFVETHTPQVRTLEVKIGKPEKSGECTKKEFDLSLFKLLGIKGFLELCGGGDNWTLKVHVCLILLGMELWCTDFTLSPQNTHVCFDVDLWLVNAKLCFGVRTSRVCFYVSGRACYFDGGWNCESFDETILCLLP
jgi:hypothetical protein